MKQATIHQGDTGRVAHESMSSVGRELNVAMDEARVKLELYLERGDNLDPLAECADTLHMIRGVLNVVELYGAAQLADEMELVTRFVVDAPSVPRGDALEVLSRALVQLPVYLDRLVAGARDIPFVLLPLLNDLRTVRGAPLLNENTLFLLNVSHNELPPEALKTDLDARPLAELCKKLRGRFQVSLLGWIKGNSARKHLQILLAISIEIEEAAREPAVHRLWRVVGALLEALRDRVLEPGAAVKRLLGQVDQQIKRIIDEGEAGVARQPPDDLVNNILYYVGRARGGGHRVKDVKRAFDLEKLLPTPDRVVRERDGLAGPSPDLMRTVGAALKDDLSQVKDGLDIFMRTGRKNPEDLQDQRELLKKIGDTLSMLGLGRLRRDVEIENARLARMVTGAIDPDESSLMDIAATLLKLEDKLDKELLQLIDPRRESGAEEQGSEDDADYRAVAKTVISECLVNLSRVKDAIVSFVAHSDDPNVLEDVSGLMRGIRSAMLLLERERVSDLVARIGDYIQHHIRFSGKPPGGAQVERVADAIVSLEYYLETLRAGRSDPWYMLDNAETCMQALRRMEELPEFESSDETAASVTQIYREGVGAPDHGSTTQVGFAPTRVLRRPQRKFEVFSPGERSDPEFLELFVEEAKEEMGIIRSELSRLKVNKSDKEALQTLRRSFHTLKGSGRMVGAQLIGEFAWSLENLLNRAIDGTLARDDVVGIIEPAANALPELIEQLEVGTEPEFDVDGLMSAAWALADGMLEGDKTTVFPPLDETLVRNDAATEATREMAVRTELAEAEAEQASVAIEMDTALLEIFAKETASHLQTLRQYVESCADKESPYALNEDVRRAVHTLHGSANMASVAEIVAIAEPLDHYVSECFNAGQRVPGAALRVLEDAAAVIEAQVACINQAVALPETRILRGQIEDLHLAASEPEVPTEGLEVGEFEVLETEDEGDTILTRLIEIPGAIEDRPELLAGQDAAASEPESPELPPTLVEIAAPLAKAPQGPSYDPEIAGIFVDEAAELLDNADAALQALQKGDARAAALDELKRQLHTLKGGARMVGITPMGDLSHELESLLQRQDHADEPAGEQLLGILQESIDRLHQMRDQVSDGVELAGGDGLLERVRTWTGATTAEPEVQEPVATEPVQEMQPEPPQEISPEPPVFEDASLQDQVDEQSEAAQAHFELPAPVIEPVRARFDAPATIAIPEQRPERQERARVDADLLQRLLDNAGEISIFRARIEQQVNSVGFNLAELSQTVTRLRDQLRKLEIETEAQMLFRHQAEDTPAQSDFDPLEMDRYSNIQQLSRSLAETTGDLMSIQELLDNLVKESESLLVQQSRVATELQHDLMRTRMVPFQQNAQRIGRLVRQTASEAGKQVELHIEGGQGEMDRQMLERMMPVLEHMARNAVVHGIEDSEERTSLGKPDTGHITIKLRREGAETVIELGDDGRGLDLSRIRERAAQENMIGEDDSLTDEQIMQLVFEPGLSTASEVTQTAGRGVGMDVAANEVRQLGGSIHIESRSGQGARFTVRLPFTMAISQALLVRMGDETFALPLTTVEGVTRIPRAELEQRMSGNNPTLEYGGREYPLQYLGALLGNPAIRIVDEHVAIPVVLVRAGEQSAALITDDLLGGREIVVKSVGPHLSTIRGIAGATILGDGSTVLILDLGALIRSGPTVKGLQVAEETDQRTFVLVVDDSITVRRVTQRLLERNGMRVMTAKDGVDAVTLMQEHKPDVILLDIEMPRMDGYEVAAHVRDDPRLQDVPIVMITSRVGLKHRARAIELGVNDYLGKPYQESQLLEAIEPLVAREVLK